MPRAPALPVLEARGPFATLDSLCQALRADHDASDTTLECRRTEDGGWDVPVDGTLSLAPPPVPFTSVRVIAAEGLDVSCFLLLQLDQWYVSPAFECGSERSRSDLEYRVTALEARDLAPGAAEEMVLRVNVRSTFDERDHDDEPSDTPLAVMEAEQLMLCGLAGERPVCTAPLLLEVIHSKRTEDGTVTSREVTRATVQLGDGYISIARPSKVPAWPDGWPPVGTYVLPFGPNTRH
jgi:hypothetical protein